MFKNLEEFKFRGYLKKNILIYFLIQNKIIRKLILFKCFLKEKFFNSICDHCPILNTLIIHVYKETIQLNIFLNI